MTTTIQVVPNNRKAIYRAAELIATSGPRTLEALCAVIDFGPRYTHLLKMAEAFETGWLARGAEDTIVLTDFSREFFAARGLQEAKPIGRIVPAPYRKDWRASSLSPKNIPNRRGMREVPEWSVKPDGYSIKTVSGGEA